ncbi:MAG: DUF2934 domain-containing protein [Pseudomonadota bacterium]
MAPINNERDRDMDQDKKDKLMVSERERQDMIAAVAYGKAEKRGFKNFRPDIDPSLDWNAAEKEVNSFLNNGK